MLYDFLRTVFTYTIHQYFSEIQVLNEEQIPVDKPVILLPNHRSAFMDPIVVATILKPEMHFLTRGESFRNKTLARVFRSLNMIPIYRKSFSPDEVHKNEEVFTYCYDLLERNGALMIFPEGLCQTRFELAPLKTGTARIALGAENKNDWELDIHLIPVGINYSHPHHFRSRLVLNVGKPIRLSQYQKEYENNPSQTVHELTSAIEEELRSLIIILHNQEDSELIRNTELVFKSENREVRSWFDDRKLITDGINFFRHHDHTGLDNFDQRVRMYLKNLKRLYPEKALNLDTSKQLEVENLYLKIIILILTFPGYLLGLATHLPPFLITAVIAKKVVKRSDFTGSVLLFLGLIIFTLFASGESYLIQNWLHNRIITATFFLLWTTLGIFTYLYHITARLIVAKLWSRLTLPDIKGLQSWLENEKLELQTILENAYKKYEREKEKTEPIA
ncbi:MAG: hypothetical protein GC181_12470 [Bacteroidetes bacterium]|nr:hypothetical protein [Bacteroidota bacterium]